ncbi:MAG: hypothetical protein V2B13_09820 [Pseudomonadota bacterium]
MTGIGCNLELHGCPCGFLSDPQRECHCTYPLSEAIQYHNLDRRLL